MTASLPQPKAGIMDIKAYVAGKSTASGAAKNIIKLSSNENPLGPSPKALAAIAEHAGYLARYPDSAALRLREAIAEVHKLDASRIVCGAGSDELIGLLVHAYAGAGDEVLFSEHGFLMYKIYAQSFGATPVIAKEQNLTAHVDNLLAAVTARTRIVFVANPNNPTGTYLPATEMKRLRDGLPSHIILAIDGAYAEYMTTPDYTDGRELVDAGENTVMLRTFSKIYGLASLRLGWGYYPQSIADVMHRVRGPFNVSGVAIAAGTVAMLDTDYTRSVTQHNSTWLAWTTTALQKLGLTIHPSFGNFILIDFNHADQASAANQFLLARGIIIREVAGYGLPSMLRMTIGTEAENKAVVDALGEFLK